jgi:CBS domain-containing protein
MSVAVKTFPASATVGEVRARFAEGGHGAYPIVEADGSLVAIVTRGDLLRDDGGDDEPLVAHASAQVLTVGPTDRAQTALRIMVDEHIEHLPVLDDGRLVGICTRTDLLKVRRRHYELERPQAGLAARLRGRSSSTG